MLAAPAWHDWAKTMVFHYKVVNWLRAAAILARVDVLSKGYVTIDSSGNYRLPPLKQLGDVNLLGQNQSNLLIETKSTICRTPTSSIRSRL